MYERWGPVERSRMKSFRYGSLAGRCGSPQDSAPSAHAILVAGRRRRVQPRTTEEDTSWLCESRQVYWYGVLVRSRESYFRYRLSGTWSGGEFVPGHPHARGFGEPPAWTNGLTSR